MIFKIFKHKKRSKFIPLPIDAQGTRIMRGIINYIGYELV